MPAESAPTAESSSNAEFDYPPLDPLRKCSRCGSAASTVGGSSQHEGDRHSDVIVLGETLERICGGCVRSFNIDRSQHDAFDGIQDGRDLLPNSPSPNTSPNTEYSEDRDAVRALDSIPINYRSVNTPRSLETPLAISQSLPSQSTLPWSTRPAATDPQVAPPLAERSQGSARAAEPDTMPNPLLDVTKSRIPSIGRGALYAGSTFRGTQTSGRSAYEVEVKFVDVNFPDSTVSGYLSISHLTDAHPNLTTFFTGEIISHKNGFITGSRFSATEHDDMRHWGRFEQFRRPSTRADMVRPELFLRDPLPDRNRGETRAKERDFVFLRIKERFLVPDHRVRDISGASFAGFYYAMVDLAPLTTPETPTSPISSTTVKLPRTATSPTSPISPTLPRRMSSSGDVRPVRPDSRGRRQSSSKLLDTLPARGEATIRGYYFHSLNQEPFQELFLTHVPERSSSTFEFR